MAEPMTGRELHVAAMDALELARSSSERSAREILYRRALELELEAAFKLRDRLDAEPTRSILLLGAAVIAKEALLFEEAIRYAAQGLAGNPPLRQREQLLNVVESARRAITLREGGYEVSRESILGISLDGAAIEHGRGPWEPFARRVEGLRRMLFRASLFAGGVAFEARPTRSMRSEVALSPGSLRAEVSIMPSAQGVLPMELPPELIVLRALERFVNDGDVSEVIDKREYRENFLYLARDLLPDGRTVDHVRIFGRTEQGSVVVDMERPKSYYKSVSTESTVEREVVGDLKKADSTGSRERIVIVSGSEKIQVEVESESMLDIVSNYYGKSVVATIAQQGKINKLVDLTEVDS